MSDHRTESRAREPDAVGFAAAADGLRLYWEVHGSGSTTIVLLPPNPISHSRIWKAQVPYLARHHRVVVYDGRGNGRSDSPAAEGTYFLNEWYVGDCLAVMDATGTEAGVLAGICSDGVWPAVQIAADQPERVVGLVAIGAGVPLLTAPHPWKAEANAHFEREYENPVGWQKMNRHHIRRDYRDFLEFFFRELFPEPHSEKQIEDAVAYGLDGSVEAFLLDPEPVPATREEAEATCRRVACPVLVIHGERDNCQPYDRGLALAELTGAHHIGLRGAGHVVNTRHPVAVNDVIHDFVSGLEPFGPRRRVRICAAERGRRALYVSSPIGLGHVRRDLAIAEEVRRLHPDLKIEWLAQHPVTTLLEERGERVHPLSSALASESRHWTAQSSGHALNAFQALRRMDEILVANFMVFLDAVRRDPYDVWIADEAWEVDYFLHENPELKTAAYVWITDFVGYLPCWDSDERERCLVADLNAEMLQQVGRFPRLRDRSIFVGDPDDVVADRFGPGLPSIREWTEKHFNFCGYIPGFSTGRLRDRDLLRTELGYRPDEQVCLVTVGGSGVGDALLQRVTESYPAARKSVPGLRMIAVAGPRIDPATLTSAADGVEIRAYVPDLYRHLAACDLAIVQAGLTTTMELTLSQRPFIYVPLEHHFEQQRHVDHRLRRYRGGHRLDFPSATPDALAAAIAEEIGREVNYVPVKTNGATLAAGLIAELL